MITVSVTFNLDSLIIFQIPEELPQICATIIRQYKDHFLDIFQIIYETTEHLTVGVDQRLDVLQIICINVIIEEREKRHLTSSMQITFRVIT